MPADVLSNIPQGADVFLDANIFVYAFTGASPECEAVLARCAREEVFGVTSFEVINEVTHRLMVAEAFQKGSIARPRAENLRKHPEVIQGLADYWAQISQIFHMNLVIVSAEEAILRRAQRIRAAHGLLTLDSVLVATMEEYSLVQLASHDHDFDRLRSLAVYHPTDVP